LAQLRGLHGEPVPAIEQNLELDRSPRVEAVDRPARQAVGLKAVELAANRRFGCDEHLMHDLPGRTQQRESMRPAIHQQARAIWRPLQPRPEVVREPAIEPSFGRQYVRPGYRGIEEPERYTIQLELKPGVLGARDPPDVPPIDPDAIEPVDDADRVILARPPRCLSGAT